MASAMRLLGRCLLGLVNYVLRVLQIAVGVAIGTTVGLMAASILWPLWLGR